jgi:hypothetical protein
MTDSQQTIREAASKALGGEPTVVLRDVATPENVEKVAREYLEERGQDSEALAFEESEAGTRISIG